jgi:hypothetical protein
VLHWRTKEQIFRLKIKFIFSIQSANTWRWGCQPYAPTALNPRKVPRNLFTQKLCPAYAQSAAGRNAIWETNSLIGNGTRNLPTCNTVPQPTTRPHAFLQILYITRQTWASHMSRDGSEYRQGLDQYLDFLDTSVQLVAAFYRRTVTATPQSSRK